MRLALKTVATDTLLSVQCAILPDPAHFPVTVLFKKTANKWAFDGIKTADVVVSKTTDLSQIKDAGSILNNLGSLMEDNILTAITTPSAFTTAVEERHGRQVVQGVGGKLTTIGKIKEKAAGVKPWRPVVAGKPVNDKALIIEADSEKEAAKKMQIRFVTSAADDKKLAVLIGTWLADGCKVEPVEADIPTDFVDLHNYK